MQTEEKYKIQRYNKKSKKWIADNREYSEKEISVAISVRYPKDKAKVIRAVGKIRRPIKEK